MNIDGNNLILGRLASITAKKALLGKKVNIVNCEKIVISGRKEDIFKKSQHLREIGNKYNGPFIPRIPDRFVRRTIRRMLPKNARGKEALKRIMCYNKIPENLKEEKLETIKEAEVSKLSTLRVLTVQKLCRRLGGNV